MSDKKLGFIGLGNMAEAMIGGMLKRGIMAPENIIGSSRTEETASKIREKYDITVILENRKVAEMSDILFLAVKPQILPEVIGEIRDYVREETVVVSIAAGKTLADLQSAFGETKRRLIRCMPNTPALVLEGCTGVCAGEGVSAEELETVVKLLESFGRAGVVPERLMDVVVGISGSSPAYVFLFLEAMADEAVAAGMPRNQAYEFAAQAILGSARLALETGRHPGQLKDMVCSPGGTTIEAVKTLERRGFRGAVIDAVEACIEKSKML